MSETSDGSMLAGPEVYADVVASAPRDVSFRPADVTEALGLTPTETRRVGDPRPRGKTSRYAWWSKRVFEKQVAFYADDVVRAALEPLADKMEAIAALQVRGIDFQLSIVVESHATCDREGDPTVHDVYLGLSRQSVAGLAAVSFGYDVEQLFLP